ncbi:DUF192 domain-containing protein [Candidatus Microgenomates bacterium]|nr:DUF192 domain-containing protein [Candidatus Microgenomates bacterium]
MKQILLLFGLLVAMILVAAWLTRGGFKLQLQSENTMKVGDTTLTVEIADTPEAHEKGLSGKDSLGESEGMLFVMTADTTPSFWMRDMRFAVDILWINDGKVTQMTESAPVPSPGASLDALPRYTSSVPIDYVLEVNAGWARAHNITVGTPVELPASIK